jgi:hypothetical protein
MALEHLIFEFMGMGKGFSPAAGSPKWILDYVDGGY